jgi:hypothetical protein
MLHGRVSKLYAIVLTQISIILLLLNKTVIFKCRNTFVLLKFSFKHILFLGMGKFKSICAPERDKELFGYMQAMES